MTEVKGSWHDSLKGGVFIIKTLRANPQFSLNVDKDTSASVTLSIPAKINGTGLALFILNGASGNAIMISPTVVADSTFDYDVSHVTVSAELKAKNNYVLVPCWDSDEGTLSGDFTLKSSASVKLAPLSKHNSKEVKGKWDDKTSGGDKDSKKFDKNEPFFFHLKKKDTVQMTLTRDEGRNMRYGFYIFDSDSVKKAQEFSPKAILAESEFVDLQSVSLTKELEAGLYVIVPCANDVGDHGKFTLQMWSNNLESLFSPSAVSKADKTAGKLSVSSDGDSKRHRRSSSAKPDKEGSKGEKEGSKGGHARNGSDADFVEKAEALMNALELKKQKAAAKKFKKDFDELKEKYDEEKKKWDSEHAEALRNKDRADRMEREKSKLSDEVAFLRKQSGNRVEELMLAVEKLNIEIEKYRKKETAAEDGIDWTLPVTTGPKSGKHIEIVGEWKGKTAGGCLNHLSWRHNPQILLNAPKNTDVTVTVYQERKKDTAEMHEISVYVFKTYTNQMKRLVLPWTHDNIVTEGSFQQEKPSKVSVSTPLLGTEYPYVIVPSTFLPNDEGKWCVHIESQYEVTATLTNETHSFPVVQDVWRGSTAGGCPNFRSFVNNPMYSLTVNNYGQVRFFLLQEEKPHEVFDTMSIYLIRAEGDSKQKLTVFKKSNEVTHLDFSKPTEALLTVDGVAPGKYIIVPCTFSPAQEAAFSLYVLTTVGISALTPLADPFFLETKGSWKGATAGGTVMNKASWPKNPQYALSVPKNMILSITLSQERPAGNLFGIGVIVTSDNGRASDATTSNVVFKADLKKESIVMDDVPFVGRSGPYTLIPSTFNPGEECNFTIRITSTDPDFQSSVKLTAL